jgi:LPXTG-motif cell wall-anchored protein
LHAATGIAAGMIAVIAISAPPAFADTPSRYYVPADQIATDGSTAWQADITNNARFSEEDDGDATQALRLQAPTATDGIRVLHRYQPDSRPTDVPALLQGASYTYRGSNVNFQLELFFSPSDPEYGPDAVDPADRCTQAVDVDGPVAGECYTVIKWEPFASADAWSTTDLSAETAADSATGTAGWKNTNRIGIYAKPGAMIGNTMSEYLAQMKDYTVIGAGIALGSGSAGADAWVRDVAFGGADYRFSVGQATALQLSAPASAPAGFPLAVTASVQPTDAQGTVTFFNGATSVGTVSIDGGVASITMTDLPGGSLDLHADFTPAEGAGYAASASPHVTVVVTKPSTPEAPPAASDAGLQQLIATTGIDVSAATASFETQNTLGLSSVDAATPFSGALPWQGADAFVDVYAYSSPVYIGTFPVVDGKVRLIGADLSALEAGDHHLVFRGQASGELSVIAVTVSSAAGAHLANTGSEVSLFTAAGLLLCAVGGGTVLVAVRRKRPTRSA